MNCSHQFRRDRAAGTRQSHVDLGVFAFDSHIVNQPEIDD